ncbi:CDP-alcohol phosphatidyltransferase family protein [Parabacteroides sp. OttesenSCG-928-G21]|nr:CDP-alcohol phosphatidyltransferase family protein [Parabacteroides sp. OttesenSCG-928-G21]
MGEKNTEYEASLKSIETENYVDRIFYRPIGFRIACLLRNTGITPNMVTIISIFVGVSVGFLFYQNNLLLNIAGIALLICANILDCVDGQLARLTGIKSEIGRILDGVAGDLWFLSIYVGFALRLSEMYGTYWFFLPAVISGFSHLVQANITDYYKTLHLFFISKEKGKEFQTLEQIKANYAEMKPGVSKVFYYLYIWYTLLQVKATPALQQLLRQLHEKYGDNIPEDLRLRLRKANKELMKYVDLMTFNGRTIVMFLIVLTGKVWVYFIYEIVILNIVLGVVLKKSEKKFAPFLD